MKLSNQIERAMFEVQKKIRATDQEKEEEKYHKLREIHYKLIEAYNEAFEMEDTKPIGGLTQIYKS